MNGRFGVKYPAIPAETAAMLAASAHALSRKTGHSTLHAPAVRAESEDERAITASGQGMGFVDRVAWPRVLCPDCMTGGD